MGDPAAEDLFVLAAETGIEHIAVILGPLDLRTQSLPPKLSNTPPWIPELYANIQKELLKLKKQSATDQTPR